MMILMIIIVVIVVVRIIMNIEADPKAGASPCRRSSPKRSQGPNNN